MVLLNSSRAHEVQRFVKLKSWSASIENWGSLSGQLAKHLIAEPIFLYREVGSSISFEFSLFHRKYSTHCLKPQIWESFLFWHRFYLNISLPSLKRDTFNTCMVKDKRKRKQEIWKPSKNLNLYINIFFFDNFIFNKQHWRVFKPLMSFLIEENFEFQENELWADAGVNVLYCGAWRSSVDVTVRTGTNYIEWIPDPQYFWAWHSFSAARHTTGSCTVKNYK